MDELRKALRNIARGAAGGKNRPAYNTDPDTFEPHAWVMDAIDAAYRLGHSDGEHFRQAEIDKGRRHG